MKTESLEASYRYCGWITSHHYENFPVASVLLPKAVRPHVAAIYAFARSADDFADETRDPGCSLELLESWRAALHRLPATDHRRLTPLNHPIFLALHDTIQKYDLPVQLLDDLLTAFTMDVTKKRYSDWDDLLNYCRHSANPVGRVVLLIFGIRDERLHRLSDCICTALQLANHWQDLAADWARDVLYIPADLMREYGVTEHDLTGMGQARTLTPAGRSLMVELVRRADALFDQGAPLIPEVSGRLALELKVTLSGGRQILRSIEDQDYNTFARRPALSSWTKLQLLGRAVLS